MTREWGRVVDDAVSSLDPAADPLRRITEGVVATVRGLRADELLRRIIDVDPEVLLPYLLERRGRSQDLLAASSPGLIRKGQRHGSIRDGDADVLARSLLLACHGFALSAQTMTEQAMTDSPPATPTSPSSTASSPTSSNGSCSHDPTDQREDPGRPRRHPRFHRRPRHRPGHHRRGGSPRCRDPRSRRRRGRCQRRRLRHQPVELEAGPRRPALPGQGTARRRPRERRRARHPDADDRSPPGPRAPDADAAHTRVSRVQATLARGGIRAGDLLRLAARTRRETLPRPRRIGDHRDADAGSRRTT